MEEPHCRAQKTGGETFGYIRKQTCWLSWRWLLIVRGCFLLFSVQRHVKMMSSVMDQHHVRVLSNGKNTSNWYPVCPHPFHIKQCANLGWKHSKELMLKYALFCSEWFWKRASFFGRQSGHRSADLNKELWLEGRSSIKLELGTLQWVPAHFIGTS